MKRLIVLQVAKYFAHLSCLWRPGDGATCK